MDFNPSDATIQVTKKILFGNQKQANKVNDSVANIVSEYLKITDETYKEVIRKIYEFLTNFDPSNEMDAFVATLLLGDLSQYKEMSNPQITMKVYSTTGRIVFGCEEKLEDTNSTEDTKVFVPETSSEPKSPEEIIQRMSMLIPNSVKEVLPNVTQQCLLLSESLLDLV